MWATAMRNMVSLSGLRANAEHVGTMSDNSVIYAVILLRLRRSISQWFSLQQNAKCSGQQGEQTRDGANLQTSLMKIGSLTFDLAANSYLAKRSLSCMLSSSILPNLLLLPSSSELEFKKIHLHEYDENELRHRE